MCLLFQSDSVAAVTAAAAAAAAAVAALHLSQHAARSSVPALSLAAYLARAQVALPFTTTTTVGGSTTTTAGCQDPAPILSNGVFSSIAAAAGTCGTLEGCAPGSAPALATMEVSYLLIKLARDEYSRPSKSSSMGDYWAAMGIEAAYPIDIVSLRGECLRAAGVAMQSLSERGTSCCCTCSCLLPCWLAQGLACPAGWTRTAIPPHRLLCVGGWEGPGLWRSRPARFLKPCLRASSFFLM